MNLSHFVDIGMSSHVDLNYQISSGSQIVYPLIIAAALGE